jgi:phosphatidylserine decarboxylase
MEGVGPVVPWLIALLVLVVLLLGGLWFMRTIWFHRDPDHSKTEQNDSVIRSPVYGRVAYIRKVEGGSVESTKLGERIPISDITKEEWPADCPEGNGWLIGIAMTALDVHFQYAPVPGVMGSINHIEHGRNLPMFDLWEYIRITWLKRHVQLFAKRYVFDNERQTMWIQGKRVRLALILIADKFVSKISTFVKAGDTVPGGGKLSFIARGSQVDVLVCGHPDLRIEVAEGQIVRGPASVLARIP